MGHIKKDTRTVIYSNGQRAGKSVLHKLAKHLKTQEWIVEWAREQVANMECTETPCTNNDCEDCQSSPCLESKACKHCVGEGWLSMIDRSKKELHEWGLDW